MNKFKSNLIKSLNSSFKNYQNFLIIIIINPNK